MKSRREPLIMELNLEGGRSLVNAPISKLIVHDEEGTAQFILEFDRVEGELKFKAAIGEDITDLLIQSKTVLTTEKGVEAFGSFISGADKESPMYRHLLTVYLPKEDSTFDKYHITLDDKLEHLDLEDVLLMAAECYAILYDALQEFRAEKTITLTRYPLLKQFFLRKYRFEPYELLMKGQDLDGSPLKNEEINESIETLLGTLDLYEEYIDAADLFIMTISGAVMAHAAFMNHDLINETLHQMTHSTINSPGIFTADGVSTLWFPFTKSRVGKIGRAFSTTLNTFSYASPNKDMQEQVQTNIAHKFHDLIEIVAGYHENNLPSYGLQTNVGQLACSIKFREGYGNDMGQILKVSHEVSEKVKAYGQAILGHVAKLKKFDTVTE